MAYANKEQKHMRWIMSRICSQCGKTVDGEGVVFCPYCGSKLTADITPETRNEEAEKWVRKALAVNSYPERKKILLKGLEACPDSLEIAWEMLFIGEEAPRKAWGIDFSIIKCWILEIYWKPGDFSEEKRNRMRAQFFDDPELVRCLNRFENPQDKQREYLLRLCREYVELFLEGNNQVMGNVFGFHIGIFDLLFDKFNLSIKFFFSIHLAFSFLPVSIQKSGIKILSKKTGIVLI